MHVVISIWFQHIIWCITRVQILLLVVANEFCLDFFIQNKVVDRQIFLYARSSQSVKEWGGVLVARKEEEEDEPDLIIN